MSTESSGLQSTRRVLILFPTPACTILLVEQYIPHDLALCGPQNAMCAEKNKRSTQPRPLGMSAKEEVFGDANRNIPDSVWKLLEDCWQTERTLRPSVGDVSGFVRTAVVHSPRSVVCPNSAKTPRQTSPISVGYFPTHRNYKTYGTLGTNYSSEPLPSARFNPWSSTSHACRAFTLRSVTDEDSGSTMSTPLNSSRVPSRIPREFVQVVDHPTSRGPTFCSNKKYVELG